MDTLPQLKMYRLIMCIIKISVLCLYVVIYTALQKLNIVTPLNQFLTQHLDKQD